MDIDLMEVSPDLAGVDQDRVGGSKDGEGACKSEMKRTGNQAGIVMTQVEASKRLVESSNSLAAMVGRLKIAGGGNVGSCNFRKGLRDLEFYFIP